MKDARRLDHTTDAKVWAQEFMEVVATGSPVDERLLTKWFANAMETARRASGQEPEYVILPRTALFEFMGEVALPPWQDADGNQVGSHVDCAPLAQKIVEWVDLYDMSDTLEVVAS